MNKKDHGNKEIEKQRALQVLSITFLPEHVIFDHILPNLPVKSLVRFKSVSKDWFSLISSPHFIETQLQFSSSSRNEFLLLNYRDQEFLTLSYDEHDLIEFTPLRDELKKLGKGCTFIGCCNGLICVYLFDKEVRSSSYFVIWNPAIRVYKVVTLPNGATENFDFDFDIYGFGYVSSDNDYKIVFSSSTLAHRLTNSFVFSLKQGKWNIIEPKIEYLKVYYYWGGGVYVDGTLFWTSKVEKTCLLSFDLVTEEFKAVNGHSHWAIGCVDTALHVIRGCLALCCYGKFGRVDVWIRKQKGGLSELWDWDKVFGGVIKKSFGYITLSRFGNFLVYPLNCWSPGEFKLVDPAVEDDFQQSKCIEHKGCEIIDVGHYCQSLISPFDIEDD